MGIGRRKTSDVTVKKGNTRWLPLLDRFGNALNTPQPRRESPQLRSY
jgi:hypothetical protein